MKTDTKEFFGLSYDRIFKAAILNKEKDYRYLNELVSDILEEEVHITKAEAYEVKVSSTMERVKILDILATTQKGKLVNIELNKAFGKSIKERNIFYYNSLITREYKHKKEYEDIKKIFQINLNFNKIGKAPKEEIKLYNLTLNEIYYDDYEIIDVNVLNYKKTWYDRNIKGEEEHIYLTALEANEEELKKLGEVNEIVKEVGMKVFELNEDEKIIDQMERERDAEIVYHNGLKYAKEDGYNDGVKVGYDNGIKTGYDNGIETMVKNLLKDGFPLEAIAKAANLTVEEVEKIQKSSSRK